MLIYLLTKPQDEARFWTHVKKGDGCWEWTGQVLPHGYGHIHWLGRKSYAHRISYRLNVGHIPPGLDVMHACDNRRCVRPSHLSLGTRTENMADCYAKGRGALGNRFPHAKLTPEKVLAIRAAFRSGTHQHDLARKYAVTKGSIRDVLIGRTWNHVKESR